MQAADQAAFVGIEADRHQIDIKAFGFEQNIGAGNGEFADPALAKTAADHDALGIGPRLGLQKFRRHIGELAGEFLDRAVNQRGGADVFAHQGRIELAFGDFLSGFTAQRIVAVFLERLAQIVEDLAKGPLAGAIAEKAVIVLQLDIEAVDVDRRQTGSAMPPDADGRQCVLSHFSPAGCLCWGTTSGEPVGFMALAGPAWICPFGAPTPRFWRIFGPVYLDLGPQAAISPLTRRGRFLALFVFARTLIEALAFGFGPIARKLNP